MASEEDIIKRIKKLEEWSHPSVDWDEKIDVLALKVKKLSKLINKRRK